MKWLGMIEEKYVRKQPVMLPTEQIYVGFIVYEGSLMCFLFFQFGCTCSIFPRSGVFVVLVGLN